MRPGSLVKAADGPSIWKVVAPIQATTDYSAYILPPILATTLLTHWLPELQSYWNMGT